MDSASEFVGLSMQAVTLRHQMFDFMVSQGLGVDETLYSETDPAKKQIVDLVPDSAAKSGYKLAPSLAKVEAIGFIGCAILYTFLASPVPTRVTPQRRGLSKVCQQHLAATQGAIPCRPYYRNKTRYPSVVYPRTGDPDVDSRVYSFFVR